MTLEELIAAAGAKATFAQKFLMYIAETFDTYEINTPIRQLCFLAQVGHESGGLFYTEELASGQAYEGRKSLGNIQPGDGVRFKGRGLIQITGRANYKSIGDDLGVDFISAPTLLGGKNVTVCTEDQLKYAALSAGWYWGLRKLNNIADLIDIQNPIDTGSNLQNFQLITKRINGGFNGLADRLSRYKNGHELFLADASSHSFN